MNREIKFRVWDNKENKWITHWLFNSRSDLIVKLFDNLDIKENYVVNPKNYVVQQFTGLKDKNEKEIYEGDIIKHYAIFGIVKYSSEFMAFYVETKEDTHLYGINFTKLEKLNFEIIGNIFENPQLLT